MTALYRLLNSSTLSNTSRAWWNNQYPSSQAGEFARYSYFPISRLVAKPIKSLAEVNLGTIVIVAIYFFSTIILSLVMGWKLALGAIFGALPLIFGAALLRERMEQSLSDVSSKTFACSARFASECMQALNDLARYGCRLLLLHEYNTTQFLVVFVAIVLSAQSTGAFLGHVSDTYLCLGLCRSTGASQEH
jgi:ABC-type multidrug transport system fused ATPase/permease subunit